MVGASCSPRHSAARAEAPAAVLLDVLRHASQSVRRQLAAGRGHVVTMMGFMTRLQMLWSSRGSPWRRRAACGERAGRGDPRLDNGAGLGCATCRACRHPRDRELLQPQRPGCQGRGSTAPGSFPQASSATPWATLDSTTASGASHESHHRDRRDHDRRRAAGVTDCDAWRNTSRRTCGRSFGSRQ